MIADFTSAYLIKRDTLADIKPSFKEDTDIVPPSPHEPAFCNCKKAVKRDVEVYWKKTQPISVDLGVCPANAVSSNAQFSAFKKKQAICGMLDHVPSSVRGRAGFGTFRNSMFNQR
ncbi:hypothetical protein ABIF70_009333 [Bradyrhizobium japonicum]